MRLNKFIANSGFCSRRKADEWIEAGQVTINGKMVTKMGVVVNPQKDVVKVQEKTISAPAAFIIVLLHKPTGYTTTKSDPYAEKTIYSLLPSEFHTLHPVGRLDKDSEGLILLTNDGALTQKLTHAKHGSEKVYRIKVKGEPSFTQLRKLEQGIDIKEETDGRISTYRTQPCVITPQKDPHIFEVKLKEGRKRQIRKMFNEIRCPVLYLKRLSMGPYRLGNLEKGQWMVYDPDASTQP